MFPDYQNYISFLKICLFASITTEIILAKAFSGDLGSQDIQKITPWRPTLNPVKVFPDFLKASRTILGNTLQLNSF